MKFPMRFIAAGRDYADKIKGSPEIKSVSAPYFRRDFVLETLPQRADFLITATGFYDLFINGKQITKSRLAPYISNPDHLLFYDHYDLSSFLQNGKNTIGIWLGNGFANNPGGWGWDFEKARFRAAPAVAARLDTDEIVIETDTSFKTALSPIWFDDYRGGEYYDARHEISGWAEPDFNDHDWKPAIIASPPRGNAVLNDIDPIIITDELAPVSVTQVKDGYIYDFGINMSGVCRLKIKGRPGQEIILHHGEHLLPDGSLNLSNISYDVDFFHKDIFICSGKEDIWTPTFTYHGFRYVWARGMTPEQAVPDALTYLVFNTDLEERGGFSCSDETVNTLQTLTRRSTLSNFHHFPTDCPHREKNGWTADAALSAEHTLLNLTPEKNYRQWLHCIRKAQRDDGALPGIVPTAGWGFEWGNGPAWDSVLVYLPYFTYLYRGDKNILEENTHAILCYLEYLTTRIGEDGLISIGLGDWCPPGRENDQYKSPLAFTDTVISMDICKKASFIFHTLNKSLHAEFAQELYTKIYTAARGQLISPDAFTALGDCQTSQAMAIFYDLFLPEEKPTAFKRLLEIIHRDGDVMDTGVLGARVIFHVLAEFGEAELAYRMITQDRFPSYGWWISQGATSLWEEFREDRFLSLNHHFWGDISHWFIRWLAGINYNPKRQGGAVDIRPQFVSQLQYAEGFHIAPEGEIRVRWERAGQGIRLSVTIPAEINGRIILPNEYSFDDAVVEEPCKSGVYKILFVGR